MAFFISTVHYSSNLFGKFMDLVDDLFHTSFLNRIIFRHSYVPLILSLFILSLSPRIPCTVFFFFIQHFYCTHKSHRLFPISITPPPPSSLPLFVLIPPAPSTCPYNRYLAPMFYRTFLLALFLNNLHPAYVPTQILS